jgi:hypothetical protein
VVFVPCFYNENSDCLWDDAMNSQTFTAFDKATGRVTYGGSSHAPELLENDDRGVLLGAVYTDGYLVGGVHHELPPQPSPNHTFNYTTKQWEDPRTLADLKAAQWNLIKSARSQAEYAGFTWDGSTFDSDAISQNRITGAVTLAQMSPTFVINWILADNTTRLLDQSQMAQVGAALGAHVAAQFEKGVTLRAQIEAAATPEDVLAIQW